MIVKTSYHKVDAMQLRRIALIGVLSAGFAGSAYLATPTSAQDAPPATQPTSRPARDPLTMMFQRMSRQLERLDNVTDDQKQKINDLFADTATKLNDILTADQKQQLEQQMQQMRNRFNGGGRNRGGGAGGGAGGNNAGGGGGGGAAPGQ